VVTVSQAVNSLKANSAQKTKSFLPYLIDFPSLIDFYSSFSPFGEVFNMDNFYRDQYLSGDKTVHKIIAVCFY
jgi:hypothetical protein